jgi:hypothetical protein
MKMISRLVLSVLILSTITIARAHAKCVVRWNTGRYSTGVGCQAGETLTSGGCTASGLYDVYLPESQSYLDVNNGIAYSYPAPSNWNQNGSDSNGTWQCVGTIGNNVTAYALCCL